MGALGLRRVDLDDGFVITRVCLPSLPSEADCYWAEVGGDAAVRAVEVAEFGVEIDVGTNLPGDAAAEVVSELIHAGVQEVSVDGQAAVEAVSPPEKEGVAGRTGDGAGGIEFA